MIDMYHAIQQTAEGSVTPQPVYNARTLAARNGGPAWATQKRLGQEQPVQFDKQKTKRIFTVLAAMEGHEQHKDGKILAEGAVDLQAAEQLLFEGQVAPTDKAPVPDYVKGTDSRPPYVIRGHHLHYFDGVERVSPARRASEITRSMVKDQEVINENPDRYLDIADWYYGDTIGKTEQSHRLHEKKLQANFEEFADLPDDYPLELRPAARDAICNSCDIGHHCDKARFPLRVTGAAEYDTNHISVFTHEAIRLGHREDLQLIRGTVVFSSSQEDVKGIRTNAGVLKTVLEESSVRWSDITEPVNFKRRW